MRSATPSAQPRLITLPILGAVLALLFSVGCEHDHGPTAPTNLATVEGVVVEVHDSIPVDGGVDVELLLEDDSTVIAFLPSLYTYPRPDELTLEIHERVYPVLLQLRPGDLVIAKGKWAVESTLRLWELDLVHSVRKNSGIRGARP